jgi:hypothetical protein
MTFQDIQVGEFYPKGVYTSYVAEKHSDYIIVIDFTFNNTYPFFEPKMYNTSYWDNDEFYLNREEKIEFEESLCTDIPKLKRKFIQYVLLGPNYTYSYESQRSRI